MASGTTNTDPLMYGKILVTVILISITGFGVGTLLTFISVVILGTIGVNIVEQPVLRIIVGTVTIQGLGFGSVALFYLTIHEKGFDFLMLSIPNLRDGIWIAAGLIALFLASIAINIVQTTFGIDSADHSLQELGAQNPEILLALIPLSILLVGPGEELLFRGIIQQLLRTHFGVALGIGLTSVVFAVAHVRALTGTGLVAMLVTYVVLSVILGVSYEYSENLIVPTVIHGLFNAIQFLIVYWEATTSGNEMLMLLLL